MELRHLKYFAGVVESGSFSRASQSLHVAQPALSQQIGNLEAELGVKLLARSVRGVIPTPAGEVVYRQARLILKEVEATKLLARDPANVPAGPVVVGLPWSISLLIGKELVEDLCASAKGIRLEVIESTSSVLSEMISAGRLDVAVVFDDGISAGLHMKELAHEPLMLIGSSQGLAETDRISLQDASRLPLLLFSRPNGIREALEHAASKQGLSLNILAEVNSPSLLLSAASAGVGCTVLPSCVELEWQRHVGVKAAVLEENCLTRPIYLCSSRLHPLTDASKHVADRIEALMRGACREGRWVATWTAPVDRSQEPQPSAP